MDFTFDRADIVCDRITGDLARALYESAARQAESLLMGDLEAGFSFWTLSNLDDGRWLQRTHCHVVPIRSLEEPTAHAPRQRMG